MKFIDLNKENYQRVIGNTVTIFSLVDSIVYWRHFLFLDKSITKCKMSIWTIGKNFYTFKTFCKSKIKYF